MQTFTKALLGTTLGVVFAGMASAQDDCSTPIAAGLGLNPFDSTLATESGFLGAGAGATPTLGADVFFTFVVPADGSYLFDTCTTTAFDSEIVAYLGADCTATYLGQNDDGATCSLQSELTINGLLTGQTVLIQVANFITGGVGGPGDLNISVALPPPPPPANDTCATPDVIAGVGSFAYDRTSATSSGFDGGDGVTTCEGAVDGGSGNFDVFFAWTPAVSGDYTIDTSSEGNDTNTDVHLGADCTATCLVDSDPATFTFSGAVSGTAYLIQVGNWNDTGTGNGPGTLDISLAPPPPPVPANDTCATPDVIAGEGSFPYDRSGALSSGFDSGDGVTTCLGAVDGGSGNFDVFFAWTPAASGNYTIDTSSEGNDTNTDISLGADCTATCLVDSDPATFTFTGAVGGTTYLIQIGNWNDTGTGNGPGTLDITLLPPGPANDTCATPTAAGLGATLFDNTFAVTSTPATTCGGEVIGNDMFYTFLVPADGDYTFDTIGTTFDSEISVGLGADCSAACLGTDDFNGAGNDIVDIVGALTGQTYLVRVGGWQDGVNGAGGVLNIAVTTPPPPPPANNDCSTPEAIAAEGTYVYNNEFATNSGFDGGDPLLCHSPTNPDLDEFGQQHNDLFWAFTVPCDGDYQFDTTGSTGFDDSRLSVHLGADCSATCVASNDDIDIGAGNYLSQVDLVGLVEGDTYLIQVGLWNDTEESGDGVLNITNLSGACPTNGIVEFACSPASMHLGGGAATMALSTFSPGSTPSGLNLQVTDGSAGEFGFLLVSTDHTASLAIFNGVLCLDSPFGRYNPQIATNQGFPQLNSIGQFDGAGVLQSLFGNATSTGGAGYDVPLELPFSPVGQVIAPGDTYAFQCWFRDGASANFSDSVKVLF